MFDLRKIEAFCKVCEQRSFSKAGASLFLSQPTVSAHIQALERDFETRLLDRMGRTVLPTPAGAVLYRYAKQAFDRLEAAKAEIRALSMEVAGDLLLGCSSIPAHHLLPGILTKFVEASSAAVTRQILEGELMAGIVGIPSQADPDLFSSPVLESDIVIIAPACTALLPHTVPPAAEDGRVPSLPEIDFATATSLHWIQREASSTTRRSFEEALRTAGHDARLLRTRLVVDSSHAAVQYVRAGLGVSAATRIAVEDALNRGEVRAYSLFGVKASRHFFCIMNARRMPFPAATVFLEFLLAKTRRPRSRDAAHDSPATTSLQT